MPAIVVLVKHVPDTWSTKSLADDHTLDRDSVDNVIDEVNEYAVEAALRLKEADESLEVIAATMGAPSADEALRKALAMGADDAVRLTDDALAGSDAIATAWALHNLLETVDDVRAIVMGASSSDGDTGLLAGLLAEYRQMPALTDVTGIFYDGATFRASRHDTHGTWELSADAPAIISVTDKADSPRYPNFKRMKAAKAHEITVHDLAGIGVDPAQVGLRNSATQVTASAVRPPRSAGEVVDGTDAAAAARRIADYLADRDLL